MKNKKQKVEFTRSNWDRVWMWGQFMVHDPNYRWTAVDTNVLGLIAQQIRRINRETYKLRDRVIIKKKLLESL